MFKIETHTIEAVNEYNYLGHKIQLGNLEIRRIDLS